jgi:hypothetical protein
MPLPFASLAAGALGTVLLNIVGHVVSRVLLSVGFGYVTYIGVESLISMVTGQITASLSGIPANMAAILSLLKVVPITSLYLSAFAASFLPGILGPGGFTKLVMKNPGAS